MRLDSTQDDRRARLEMTPMMDVVFLLLVYFIYAVFSMSVHNAVKVDLPQAAAPLEPAQNPTVIALDKDNALTLDMHAITLEQAAQTALANWKRDGRPVIISADRKADVGTALQLLAELRNAGVSAVSFQVSAPQP